MKLENTTRDFLLSLRQAGYQPSTVEKYRSHLQRLTIWLSKREINQPEQINKFLLREWGAGLHDFWSSATVRQAIFAVRSFLNWCYDEDIIDEPLAYALRAPKLKKRIQRTLDTYEIQALLDACDLFTPKGKRDAALVSLLVDSGLRASEICSLRLENVDFEVRLFGDIIVNMLTVIGKGGHEENAYFGQATADRMRAWLEIRQTQAQPGVDTVFVSLGGITPGQPLVRQGLKVVLKKLGQKAGVKKVTAHSMRRSFACLADEAGASSRKIQKWGRWSSIEMVERYTYALKAGRQYNRYSPMDYLAKL